MSHCDHSEPVLVRLCRCDEHDRLAGPHSIGQLAFDGQVERVDVHGVGRECQRSLAIVVVEHVLTGAF